MKARDEVLFQFLEWFLSSSKVLLVIDGDTSKQYWQTQDKHAFIETVLQKLFYLLKNSFYKWM